MSKKAVYVGINNYPGSGSDLAGCINDSNDWIEATSSYGFNTVSKLLDAQATRQNFKNALIALVSGAVKGDVLLLTYSGHGSYVADASGDETDGKDETLYLYDGNFTDDELRAILSQLPDGVSMTIILDSCHSGTATRVAGPYAPKPRFMPPSDATIAALDATLPVSRRIAFDEAGMGEILFSGCKSTEYSYDANFNGRPNGAFTRVAIDALKKLGHPTYQQWYDEIRKGLPSNSYPQTPQFEGSDANKAKVVFS